MTITNSALNTAATLRDPPCVASNTSTFVNVVSCLATQPPDATALRSGISTLTYGALEQAVGRLAGHLQRYGVSAEIPVGICLDRSFASVTATLAVLRAGGAFVPLDPAWPVDRLSEALADCGAQFVITDSRQVARVASAATAVLMDHDAAAIAAAPPCKPADVAPGQLAYVIYTSGSTGKPKGVEITHGNLQNLVAWQVAAFGLTVSDRASHIAGPGFDAAIWEVVPTLAAGASVVLANDLVRTSPILLQRWLIEHGVTIAFVPSTMAEPMLALPWPASAALRTLLTGGDVLHSAPSQGLGFAVVNNYGPAECTVVATSGTVPPGSLAPTIGRPVTGVTVLLLDKCDREVGIGEVGEIHIGGAGVGRGYHNQPDLTASRFHVGPNGGRLYRTGDLGVLLPDGQIGFCGRNDRQEKIRGQRVELDEIACVLNRHPSVAASVVLSRGTGNDKHLVAYVLPREGVLPVARALQEFVANALPAAMIPSILVRISSMPLTANGKLDRAALPEPTAEIRLPETVSREASGPVEETLLSLVRSLLGTDQVGVEDNFFLVGGHSLLGTQLVLRAREAFGIELTLRHLFESGTVSVLGKTVKALVLAEIEAMSEAEARRQVAD